MCVATASDVPALLLAGVCASAASAQLVSTAAVQMNAARLERFAIISGFG